MKQILFLILVMILLFSMTACTSTSTSVQIDTPNTTIQLSLPGPNPLVNQPDGQGRVAQAVAGFEASSRHLDGDLLLELIIGSDRAVDFAHPAPAQQLVDAETPADHGSLAAAGTARPAGGHLGQGKRPGRRGTRGIQRHAPGVRHGHL